MDFHPKGLTPYSLTPLALDFVQMPSAMRGCSPQMTTESPRPASNPFSILPPPHSARSRFHPLPPPRTPSGSLLGHFAEPHQTPFHLTPPSPSLFEAAAPTLSPPHFPDAPAHPTSYPSNLAPTSHTTSTSPSPSPSHFSLNSVIPPSPPPPLRALLSPARSSFHSLPASRPLAHCE